MFRADDDDFVQVDEVDEDEEDFEDRVADVYRLHRRGPADSEHGSVYDDVRSTLLESSRPMSGSTQYLTSRPVSAMSARPLSANRPTSATASARPLSATRPASASTARPLSALQDDRSTNKLTDKSMDKSMDKSTVRDQKDASFYLRQHKQKSKAKAHSLTETLLKRKRESQYGMLQHMAEMNEWCTELGHKTRYHVIKRGEELFCHVYEGEQFYKEISGEAMLKRYHAMSKRLQNLHADKPAAKPLSKDEQQQRQEAIRAALLHTLQITSKLKEQLHLLDSRQTFTPFLIE